MPQFAKQFYVIEENYVIFYAKIVIDDQVGSKIIDVFHNILLINKWMMRQPLREAIKRVLTSHLVEETGWRVSWQVAASLDYFQLLQVLTSLYLWSWFPKKVEQEQVAH